MQAQRRRLGRFRSGGARIAGKEALGSGRLQCRPLAWVASGYPRWSSHILRTRGARVWWRAAMTSRAAMTMCAPAGGGPCRSAAPRWGRIATASKGDDAASRSAPGLQHCVTAAPYPAACTRYPGPSPAAPQPTSVGPAPCGWRQFFADAIPVHSAVAPFAYGTKVIRHQNH